MAALVMNCLAGICSSLARLFRIELDEDYGGHADTELYFYIVEAIRSVRREKKGHEWMERFMEVMMEAQEGFVYGDGDGDVDDKYCCKRGMDGDEEDINNNGDHQGDAKRSVECAICLEEMEKGELCMAVEECRHVFHKQCLVLWLVRKKTCPICRAAAFLSVPLFQIEQLWDQVLLVDSS